MKKKVKRCGECRFNGKCHAQMQYPHDSGPDQPYCDGAMPNEKTSL